MNNMKPEIWKPVVGWEGLYEVSSLGRIKRIAPAHGTKPGRILKPTLLKVGYNHCGLTRGPGNRIMCRLSRIVATAFHGIPPDGAQCNHKNGKKADDRAENLEWVTPSENVRHRFDVLGIRNPRGEEHHHTTLNENTVRAIRRRAAAGEKHRIIAADYHISRPAVTAIVARRNWSHVS